MPERHPSSTPPPQARPSEQISDLDDGFIRVLEDLIDLLIANGTIRLTDFPPQVLEKLQERKQTRQRLRDKNSLINDDEDELI